jgi:sulfatase maturation enzyme AslB (radical SAM superfamily)
MGSAQIKPEMAINLISTFKSLGATKLTVMGGEPSLYGITKNYTPLIKVLKKSKELGYEYIRMDTNGQFEDKFFEIDGLNLLNEISFSLDGFNPETNDLVRGKDSFIKCTNNIRKALELGYNVDITTCVHRKLLERLEDGTFYLDLMIQFAEQLGVNKINFHALFKHGFPMDTWSGDTNITMNNWISAYKEINENIQMGKYKIHVRIPQHFINKAEFESAPQYYGYCPVKLGERVLVHPNGIIRICSGLISSNFRVATWTYDNNILWDNSGTNELKDHRLNAYTPCTNQSKGMNCEGYLPLCFSFKPNQREIIWENRICWDRKK